MDWQTEGTAWDTKRAGSASDVKVYESDGVWLFGGTVMLGSSEGITNEAHDAPGVGRVECGRECDDTLT